ncbi:lysozyme [bacterium]|nr:lysozyme [bacterium]
MIEKLKLMLMRDEGEVNHAYQDTEGYWTIGVGRLIDNRKGGGISHEESMYLLGNDIKTVLGQCDREFDWFDTLDEARKIVVLNMVFNLGIGNFKKFKKTIAFISAGDYDEASIEMLDSTWSSQVGNRAARLSTIMKTGQI